MQDNKTTPTKRRKVTVLRVITVLLLVAGCAFAIFRLTLRSKLNARIEAIRAAGYPVTCAELDQWYKIPPDAENAAYTLADAFSCLVEPRYKQFVPIVGPLKLPARTEPLAEETKAYAALYIIDNKEALELLHAGAAIENCRYPVDLIAGPAALFHDMSSLKDCVRLLNVEAISRADSDPGLSARSIISSFGIARSLEKEPMLVSQIVRNACLGLTVSILKHLVNRTDFTDEQLRDLSGAVVRAQAPPALLRAFVGERCSSLAILKMPPAQMARIFPPSASPSRTRAEARRKTLAIAFHRFAGLVDRSTIIYLDMMEDYIEAIQLSQGRRRQAISAIEARYRAVLEADFLLGHLTASFGRIDAINLRGIAHLQTAQAALAIQRYRLATGRLPDTLADLVPTYLDTIPVDPFDGNELRYKKLEAGFVVYSIGEDSLDDGGKEKLPRTKTTGNSRYWDITFIVER